MNNRTAENVEWKFVGQGSVAHYTIFVQDMRVLIKSEDLLMELPLKDFLDIAKVFQFRRERFMADAQEKVAMNEIGMKEIIL